MQNTYYIALLRGINAGKQRRVDMRRLKEVFIELGCTDVSTYINSGNIMFASPLPQKHLTQLVNSTLQKAFGFEIPTLIKTKTQMQHIASAIPTAWKNDSLERSDVAYLFDAADMEKIIDQLPFDRNFIDVRYVPGALLWNIDRQYYNKSHLNKLISHPLYQQMTVRNVNTARYLAK